MDGYYERSLTENRAHHGTEKESTKRTYSTHFAQYHAATVDWCNVARVTIDMVPDVVLLEVFDIYVFCTYSSEWITLVHVCQKWRNVVFGSPLRLDLQLRCSPSTPVKETLDVWPPLPIFAQSFGHEKWGVDNIIAALQHSDHICQLELIGTIPSPEMEEVLVAMQQPFPELKRLKF